MQVLHLLLLVVGVSAMRTLRKGGTDANALLDGEERGVVKNLYTLGAPKASSPALTDPRSADGNFPGLRIVNKNRDGRLVEKKSGWRGMTIERTRVPLHMPYEYVKRIAKIPHLRDMANVALANSYNDNVSEVAANVREKGFGLVASAKVGTAGGGGGGEEEVSHLIQNPETLDCFLTFEGSDRPQDWKYNFNVGKTDFCGLQQRVHRGFKEATLEIVKEPTFQENIRPNLGHCRSVEVVGHSLGGSLATLFTACAHNEVEPGSSGYEDYQYFWFKKLETKRMNYL